jgi:hypothetical protein
LILPQPETEAEAEELESRANIQEALTGHKNSTKNFPSNGNSESSPSKGQLISKKKFHGFPSSQKINENCHSF